MRPSVVVEGARVFLGDCRDVLRTLPDNSVDSVVTDPPYELGFMGKAWDNSGIAYDVTVWQECLRVLKPGGHILAFGGTRTWHRLAVAIEDAGFEIRDNIAWVYGSGFPKSLDVSKAIDKKRDERHTGALAVTIPMARAMRENGLTRRDLNVAVGREPNDGGSAQSWTTVESTGAHKPRVPTLEQWAVLRDLLGLSELDSTVWRLNGLKGRPSESFFQREVIGQQRQGRLAVAPGQGEDRSAIDLDITLAKTPEAVKWQGWGTALKPAFEPVVVGRKPIEGTVASNVLAWGVGGLNIDGSRIRTDEDTARMQPEFGVANGVYGFGAGEGRNGEMSQSQGRWPANVVLDEFTAGLLDKQSGVSKSQTGGARGDAERVVGDFGMKDMPRGGHSDSGGASRFFYQSKASKRDRNEGLNLCRCDKLQAWENEDQTAPPQADTDQSTPKDTGASGTPNNNGSEWNTSSSGSNTTDNSKTGNRSTTSTATNLTTESTTSSPLTASHTNASTRGASSETVSGGNPAKSADTRSRSTETTGMSAEKGGPSMDGANPATSPSSLSQSNVGSHQCAKCLGIIGGHPTVKPTQLMRYLIKLVTPEGGVVLDPFTGSGSTGKAALLDGFEFIGAELTEEYLPIIEGRLRWAVENRDEETLF